jgi:hypothetical protein
MDKSKKPPERETRTNLCKRDIDTTQVFQILDVTFFGVLKGGPR